MNEFTFFMNFIGIFAMSLSIVIIAVLVSEGIGIALKAINDLTAASDDLQLMFKDSIAG